MNKSLNFKILPLLLAISNCGLYAVGPGLANVIDDAAIDSIKNMLSKMTHLEDATIDVSSSCASDAHLKSLVDTLVDTMGSLPSITKVSLSVPSSAPTAFEEAGFLGAVCNATNPLNTTSTRSDVIKEIKGEGVSASQAAQFMDLIDRSSSQSDSQIAAALSKCVSASAKGLFPAGMSTADRISAYHWYYDATDGATNQATFEAVHATTLLSGLNSWGGGNTSYRDSWRAYGLCKRKHSASVWRIEPSRSSICL